MFAYTGRVRFIKKGHNLKKYSEIKQIMGVPEEWRVLEEDDNVMVSSYGRVKRRANKSQPFKLAKNKTTDRDGYKRIKINGKSVREHIAILNAFTPKPFDNAVVDHIDNDHSNNAIYNLHWVTVQENSRLAGEMGLQNREFKAIVLVVDENHIGTMYSTVTDLVKDFPDLRAEDVYYYFSGKRKSLKGYKFVRMNEINDKRRKTD